jgi:hypothetical protein
MPGRTLAYADHATMAPAYATQQGDYIVSHVTLGRCLTLLAIGALSACAGQTSGGPTFAPGTAPAASTTAASAPAGHSHFQPLGDVIKNACPGKDIACLTVSYQKPASYYFCFIPSGSQCNGGQFTWTSTFHTKSGKVFKGLSGAFDPNPGDPSTDNISETKPLAPSNGQVKYQQTIWACLPSGCEGPYHIGIITQ